MLDLSNKTVLIAGGAGDVGEELTKTFMRLGAQVVVPSRSEEKLEHLREAIGSIRTGQFLAIQADIGTEEGIESVIQKAQANFGSLQGVIASLGSWHSKGDLTEYTLAEWNMIVLGGLTSHFNLARATIPRLRQEKDAFYLLVNGAAALSPVPDSGPVSIVAAAQQMLKDVLVAENKHHSVRINSLMITSLVETRARVKSSYTPVSATMIAEYLAYLASPKASAVRGETRTLGSLRDLPEMSLR